jgi:hypothetical protein
MILDGSNGVTFNDASLQGAAASPYVLKNRIINGAMVIDQRNAGAATANTISGYTLDRWAVYQSVTGKVIVQQDAGAVTPPTGFNDYLGVTSQSSYSVLAGDFYIINQNIEGYNVADLGWGTANAKTITISFWVRSSLTGTFGGALENSAQDRNYPFTYTISLANTWELKSVTIAGDTSGTWLTTNGIGMRVIFGLGVGTTLSGPAGAWSATQYFSATGATSVVGTNGATFYITGVQLEQNTSATPFERRLYNQELANCQRYYQLNTPGCGKSTSTTAMAGSVGVQTAMRDVPTATLFTGTNKAIDIGVAFRNITSLTVLEGASVYGGNITSVVATTTSGAVHTYMGGAFAFSAEL